MIRRQSQIISFISLLCFLCTGFPGIATPAQHEGKLSATSSAPAAGSSFSFKLFEQVAKGSKDNVVVSPFSAFAALSMALNGANGETFKEMEQTLGVPGVDIDSLNKSNQAVFAELAANKKVQLEIANAVFSDNDTPFRKSFIETCKNFYSAEARNEDFNSPQTVDKINSWCAEKTHGKIPKILDSLKSKEKMVLLNAVYFKGTWEHQFNKEQTKDDQFTGLAGDQTPIKMMHHHEHFGYYRGTIFQSVSLPYAGNKQRMIVFLPNKNTDWAAFQAQFTADNWQRWMEKYTVTEVNLSLPKFKIETSLDLASPLKAMGMPTAFLPRVADFTKLIPPPCYAWISRVLQKTYMDVNEEGTEAAAVTAVVMGVCRAAAPTMPVEFRVDRPFVIALVDDPTGEILFLGSIVKP